MVASVSRQSVSNSKSLRTISVENKVLCLYCKKGLAIISIICTECSDINKEVKHPVCINCLYKYQDDISHEDYKC